MQFQAADLFRCESFSIGMIVISNLFVSLN